MTRNNKAESSWEEVQATHRNFPVKGGRGKRAFAAANLVGSYTVKCKTIEQASSGNGDDKPSDDLNLEIHGTTEDGLGMIGSFDFGVLYGMMLITGSRKGLEKAVRIADGEEADDDDEHHEDEHEHHDDDEEVEEHVEETNGNDHGGDDGEAEQAPRRPTPSRVSTSSKHSRRASRHDATHAFEKNTFRTPKFWFRWRGMKRRSGKDDELVVDVAGKNIGFLEFHGGACKEFSGTFTSELLGENVSMLGWKTMMRPSVCPFGWSDFMWSEEASKGTSQSNGYHKYARVEREF